MMFLDCPAYLDGEGAGRCGLPAQVRHRFTMRSSEGLLETAMIRCPSGHWFNGPIESLGVKSGEEHAPGTAGRALSAGRDSCRGSRDGRLRSLIISQLTVVAALCLRGPTSRNGIRAVIASRNRRNRVTLSGGVMPTIRGILVTIATLLATGIAAMVPAGASASITLDGSFSTVIVKPDFAGLCPSGVADECGTMQLAGLGAADWAYAFGPAFEPDGRCFDVDGTFTITLQSDGSAISGPLTGLFCPRLSDTGHQHAGAISYGNPFVEDDSIAFTYGTGQFARLSGSASFHTFAAGARFTGTLKGTLSS